MFGGREGREGAEHYLQLIRTVAKKSEHVKLRLAVRVMPNLIRLPAPGGWCAVRVRE